MSRVEESRIYEELRPLVFSIAYRMLGSASEAEDVVQEAFVRLHRELDAGAELESPKAWLTTVVSRLSIDQLRSARARRETYVGSWLPEPLLTSADEPSHHAETADTLSMAFLVLLESLSPVERAVFLLREVFDYPYEEIARIVERSVDNTRQIAVRARRAVDARKPRFESSRERRDELASRFFAAVDAGETGPLEQLLAADVVMYGDGGGKAPAIPAPLYGREKVMKLVLGLGKQSRNFGVTLRRVEVNGQPGAMFMAGEQIVSVLSLDIADGQVQAIRSLINPDKLRHLGEVADVRAMLRGMRSG